MTVDNPAPGEAQHIVSKYDAELAGLTSLVLRMGGMVESQMAHAIDAVMKRDPELAREVIEADQAVDALEAEIDAHATRLLALRQPMAVDLRAILTAFKLAGDIERVGDYAKNLAKRSLALNQSPPLAAVHAIPRLGAMVREMLKDVLDAYGDRDAERALAVWRRDAAVDQLYDSLFRELLTYMMEDPRTITAATHLIFMAKNIERCGDHATNMAEMIHFLITGRRLTEERPKSDESSTFAGPAGGTGGTAPG